MDPSCDSIRIADFQNDSEDLGIAKVGQSHVFRSYLCQGLGCPFFLLMVIPPLGTRSLIFCVKRYDTGIIAY